jgi:hypothetical protein
MLEAWCVVFRDRKTTLVVGVAVVIESKEDLKVFVAVEEVGTVRKIRDGVFFGLRFDRSAVPSDDPLIAIGRGLEPVREDELIGVLTSSNELFFLMAMSER